MDRLRRLSEFWNWLPAFRAVAETGHLPTASEQLGVGPSSLSRTIALLESRVGKPLFDRVGRGIVLNADGERFLAAVRDSMRRLDDGVSELRSPELLDPLAVSTIGGLTDAVLPAIREVQAMHPRLVVHVHRTPPDRVAEALLQGEIDVAFLTDPPRENRLAVEALGEASNGVYCGPGHPLHQAAEPSLDEVLEHDFVGPLAQAVGPRAELWPPELERRVVLHVGELHAAIDLCRSGELLVVIPDFVARASDPNGQLRRLPHDIIEPVTYYAVRRKRLTEADVRDTMIVHARDQLARRLG